MEIGAFLHNLRRFVAGRQQIFIGNKTIHLLDDTVTFIQDELITKAKVTVVPNETNTNFLQDLDSSHFELHRTIMCRLCNVNINFSFVCNFCPIMRLCKIFFFVFLFLIFH